jgi:hypothetical protein
MPSNEVEHEFVDDVRTVLTACEVSRLAVPLEIGNCWNTLRMAVSNSTISRTTSAKRDLAAEEADLAGELQEKLVAWQSPSARRCPRYTTVGVVIQISGSEKRVATAREGIAGRRNDGRSALASIQSSF